MYEYKAKVISIHDADTATFLVDLGFNTKIELNMRLYGINAPELSTQAGKDARDYLKSILPIGADVVINTYKDRKEKYGRYLAKVNYNGADLAELLIAKGHAVTFMDNIKGF